MYVLWVVRQPHVLQAKRIEGLVVPQPKNQLLACSGPGPGG